MSIVNIYYGKGSFINVVYQKLEIMPPAPTVKKISFRMEVSHVDRLIEYHL